MILESQEEIEFYTLALLEDIDELKTLIKSKSSKKIRFYQMLKKSLKDRLSFDVIKLIFENTPQTYIDNFTPHLVQYYFNNRYYKGQLVELFKKYRKKPFDYSLIVNKNDSKNHRLCKNYICNDVCIDTEIIECALPNIITEENLANIFTPYSNYYHIQYKVAEYLFSSGILTPNDDIYSGKTPIFESVFNIDFFKLCLKYGGDINFVYDAKYDWKFKNGWTLLHNAMMHFSHDKDFQVIKCLVELGADINSRDLEGLTPLGVLVKYSCPISGNPEHKAVAKYLYNHGARL